MDPIVDPVRIKPAKLREFAYQAAWIATATEAANDLEELVEEAPAEGRALPDFSTPWPWEFDSVALAVTVLRHNRDDADGTRFDRLARTVAARGSRRRVLGALLAGALGSLRLHTTGADDSGTAIADASGGNHNRATVPEEVTRDNDRDNNHDRNNNHDRDRDNNHDRDDDNNDDGAATCTSPGGSCSGGPGGDAVDSTCCSGFCVGSGECSTRSGYTYNGACTDDTDCCLGRKCVDYDTIKYCDPIE